MTKLGEVYKVDLGSGGKIKMMVVVSRYDMDAPRSLSLCVPITSAYREFGYEVPLAPAPFMRTKSYANVQACRRFRIMS